MHPFLKNKDDCYYTDTDSVVLGSPLPEDVISADELGKLKLVYQVIDGVFHAPKSYGLTVERHNGVREEVVVRSAQKAC
jgi:hypothetical protein